MSGNDLFQEEMFNETLIEEVQKHECIYNHGDPNFGIKSTAEKAWSAVADIVGATPLQCKKRWMALRQRYVKEHMGMASSADSGAEEYISDWEHIEAMDFMKDYVLPNSHFQDMHSGKSKRDMFCRACLRPVLKDTEATIRSYNIFETLNFCEKFMQCTNLQSAPWDEYPHSVCKKCYAKILDFYQFQVMCRDSLKKFNDMMENENEVKCEIGPKQTSDIDLPDVEEIPENPSRNQGENDLEETPGDDPLSDLILEQKYDADNPTEVYVAVKGNWSEEDNVDMIEEESGEKENEIIKVKNDQAKPKKEKRKATKRKIEKRTTRKAVVEILDEADGLGSTEDEDASISEDIDASDVNQKSSSKVLLKCDICPKTFLVQHCLEAHQRRHQGLSGYPCTYANCERGYNRFTDFRRHLNDHEGIPNVFKCDIDNCDKIYTCYSSLNHHKREYHKCGKELKKSKKEQTSKTYICETCGHVLSSQATLKIHRLIHVDKSQWPYVCDEKDCTRRFRMLSRLRIHKKRHAGIKDYVCPHCGMRKTTRHELNIHINFHTFERKYPCRICSKVFKSVGMVSTHIHKVHEGKDVKARNDGCFDCSFCERKLSTLQNKIFHEMTHTGEKPHQCPECGKTFGRPANLKQHMHMHLKGEKPYVCEECGERFKWPGPWKVHMKLHSEQKAHACEECGKRFKWASNLKSHKMLHVEGATPYTCEDCGQGFRWPGSYYAHKKKHVGQTIAKVVQDEGGDKLDNIGPSISEDFEASGENEKTCGKVLLKCDICPKTFLVQHCLEAHQRRHQGLSGYPCTYENCERGYNRFTDFRRHLNDHKGIPNVFKCDIDNCGREYRRYGGLNRHKRKDHKCGKELKKEQSLGNFVCETCGQVLSNRTNLKVHRLRHVDKSLWPFVCDEEGCTRRFRELQQLKIHKKRHAGIKDYVCPHCGMRKTTSTELSIHVNLHTFERKYPCRICSKVFKSVGTMSTHIHQVHEGKRRNTDGTIFQCSFCDHKSSHAQNMKLHEMTHTGERPYACRECGKTFASPAGRHSHMQIHSNGEKPHACEDCGKRFKWLSNLSSHKKLHVEGAVPYTCEECGQGFKWPGSYYTHKKKHVKQIVLEGSSEEDEAPEKKHAQHKVKNAQGRVGAMEEVDP